MVLQRERATEEEEEVIDTDPRTPGPTSDGGRGVGALTQENPVPLPTSDGGHRNRDDESPPESSTPGSGAELTRRDLQRVKRRFISVSEHLRDSLADTRTALQQTRTEIWEAIEDVGQDRAQDVPTYQRLLDTKAEMLIGAFEAGLRALKHEFNDFVTPLQNRVDILQSTVERVAASTQKAVEELNQNAASAVADIAVASAAANVSHEGSDWSLVEDEYFQELQGRVEVLEAGTPSGPDFGTNETQYDLHRDLEGRVSEIESVLRQRIGTPTANPFSGPAARSILDS